MRTAQVGVCADGQMRDDMEFGAIYTLHARGRAWQAEYMISGMRDHVRALACPHHDVPAVQGGGMDSIQYRTGRCWAGEPPDRPTERTVPLITIVATRARGEVTLSPLRPLDRYSFGLKRCLPVSYSPDSLGRLGIAITSPLCLTKSRISSSM